MNFDKEFDASGLACPLPIVKTKKALTDMAPGQVLRVVSTDPGSVCDMAAFAGDSPKSSPADVVRQVLDGVESGADEVLADEMTRQVRAQLGTLIHHR